MRSASVSKKFWELDSKTQLKKLFVTKFGKADFEPIVDEFVDSALEIAFAPKFNDIELKRANGPTEEELNEKKDEKEKEKLRENYP